MSAAAISIPPTTPAPPAGANTPSPSVTEVQTADGIQRVAANTTPPSAKTEEKAPEWQTKFKTPEDIWKSYKELESKIGAPKTPPAPEPPKIAEPAKSTEEVAKTAGVDLDALTAEFAQAGKLSEKSIEALKSKGITEGQVQEYIEGRQAKATEYRRELTDAVGGDLDGLLKWASNSLSDSERESINKVLQSQNKDMSKVLLSGLQARRVQATGKEPSLVQGEAVGSSDGPQPFASSAEIVTAMRDKRYATDPAYRKVVEERVAKSNFMNVQAH
jgi:hypothetical protein